MFKDKGILKALWAGMYILCAVLSFVEISDGATRVLLLVIAILFFAPPGADLWFSLQRKDSGELRLIRNLSILSLAGTTVLLLANVLSVLTSSTALGDVLHILLVLVSTPMICSHSWAWSLLLWAGLLWGSMAALRRLK